MATAAPGPRLCRDLDCGIFARGAARAHCAECGHDALRDASHHSSHSARSAHGTAELQAKGVAELNPSQNTPNGASHSLKKLLTQM